MVAPPTYLGAMIEIMETEDLLKLLGLPLKRFMRNYSKLIIFAPLVRSFDRGFTENSIMPHPWKKNRYGNPLPVVTLDPNAREQEWLETAVEHSQKIMLAAGADSDQLFTGGIDVVHKVGTCRMGTDPSTSVTDLDGKCWDLENLWIGDGSLFPAPLLANCAFIIYCLAYKVADGLLGRSGRTQKKGGSKERSSPI